jgi:hypothetical protein
VGGRDTDFEGGLSLAKRILTVLQDWSREGQEQREESLDEWNFRSLAIVIAEIVKT